MSAIQGFNPLAAAVSFIKGLQDDAVWNFDPKTDKVGTIAATDDEEETTGYLTDGTASIHYGVSVGKGRGSAKMELTGDQLQPVADALAEWDSASDLADLPPEVCVERTIEYVTATLDENKRIDTPAHVSFKLSLAKNSRAVRIPVTEWAGFVELMQANAGSVERAVGFFREEVAKANAEPMVRAAVDGTKG